MNDFSFMDLGVKMNWCKKLFEMRVITGVEKYITSTVYKCVFALYFNNENLLICMFDSIQVISYWFNT